MCLGVSGLESRSDKTTGAQGIGQGVHEGALVRRRETKDCEFMWGKDEGYIEAVLKRLLVESGERGRLIGINII